MLLRVKNFEMRIEQNFELKQSMKTKNPNPKFKIRNPQS